MQTAAPPSLDPLPSLPAPLPYDFFEELLHDFFEELLQSSLTIKRGQGEGNAEREKRERGREREREIIV